MPPPCWPRQRRFERKTGSRTVSERTPAADTLTAPGESVAEAACRVLRTADPADKVAASLAAAAAWRAGALVHAFPVTPPDRPARPPRPELVAARALPARRRGGSAAGRFALLHALAHIEFNAIDLAWDIVARFGAGLPRAFCDDWIAVGAEESQHFALLDERLHSLGGHYGDLPAHDGLWEAAAATADDLVARLAIVPLVLEARGLDVSPQTAARLRKAGDEASAAVMDRIFEDEIGHVATGVKWFRFCTESGPESAQERFQTLVRLRFRGGLKPPFNDFARDSAGLESSFYLPLAES